MAGPPSPLFPQLGLPRATTFAANCSHVAFAIAALHSRTTVRNASAHLPVKKSALTLKPGGRSTHSLGRMWRFVNLDGAASQMVTT